MRTVKWVVSILMAGTLHGACDDGRRDVPRDAPAVPAPVMQETFAAESARAGQLVGEMRLDSIDAQRAVDSSFVGTARFAGAVVISGTTMLHPDPDARHNTVCFEADSATARRLPRWRGDTRRPWFCFDNQGEAIAVLGGASEGRAATITIDRFTIERGLSDQVNHATLVVPSHGP